MHNNISADEVFICGDGSVKLGHFGQKKDEFLEDTKQPSKWNTAEMFNMSPAKVD